MLTPRVVHYAAEWREEIRALAGDLRSSKQRLLRHGLHTRDRVRRRNGGATERRVVFISHGNAHVGCPCPPQAPPQAHSQLARTQTPHPQHAPCGILILTRQLNTSSTLTHNSEASPEKTSNFEHAFNRQPRRNTVQEQKKSRPGPDICPSRFMDTFDLLLLWS